MSEKENIISVDSVESLLRELQSEQSNGDSIYPKGIFPSQRYHPILPYLREDDNLFFTASIVHILQGIIATLSESEKELVDAIVSDAKASYSLFKNKDGLDTYNFWQTKPSRHFPNGLFMHRFKHFQIPDDVDDTALVFLTEFSDIPRVSQLRKKLKQHANLAYKRAFNPLAKYQDLKCYSTFFGQRMYIEFDICVLSNLMRVILPHFKHDLNEFDKDTLEFICSSVENNEHQKLPFYSAPNYPETDIILYHLSRLIPELPEPWRSRIEEKVKSDIAIRLGKTHGLNHTLLENAAMKLNVAVETVYSRTEYTNDTSFYFFHAGMITAFENRIAQKMASNSWVHLRYKSKALNRALLIENMVLKRRLFA